MGSCKITQPKMSFVVSMPHLKFGFGPVVFGASLRFSVEIRAYAAVAPSLTPVYSDGKSVDHNIDSPQLPAISFQFLEFHQSGLCSSQFTTPFSADRPFACCRNASLSPLLARFLTFPLA